ncbi:hypothetical protein ACM9HO_17835, partial [Pseudomonas sp. KHB2.9]
HQRLPQTVAVDVLMGRLQNVQGSVHGDLLRLHVMNGMQFKCGRGLAPDCSGSVTHAVVE